MDTIKDIFKNPKYRPLVNIGLFIFITLAIHVSYRFWVRLDYYPISNVMHNLHSYFSDIVFRQSSWLIQHVLGMDIKLLDNTMYWPDNTGYMTVNESCSGVKQMIQFALLMLVFPGPMRKKAWYIPMGMFIMYVVNVIRLLILAEVLVYLPDYWQFTHDSVVRPMFYVVIFALWVYWTERMQDPKAKAPVQK